VFINQFPTLFIPHGAGPCFFMDWDPPDAWTRMAAFLKSIASTLPAVPKAIVVVSAHWQEAGFEVTNHPQPSLIYDYFGFPEHTYHLDYSAPGEPALAQRVKSLLQAADLPSQAQAERGWDHGVFIPLRLMFPQANVPVVQLSLQQGLNPQAHLAAGRALQALRTEEVLLVGSGMSFHHMRGYGDPRFGPISDEFDAWLTQAVALPEPQRNEALRNWAQAPMARLCHPPRAEEHFLPLMVMAGAAGPDAGQRVFSDRVMETTLSAFRFG
jgi:aromatic ring-opening dioxygenase catalytic subunit (LigB family)